MNTDTAGDQPVLLFSNTQRPSINVIRQFVDLLTITFIAAASTVSQTLFRELRCFLSLSVSRLRRSHTFSTEFKPSDEGWRCRYSFIFKAFCWPTMQRSF